MAARVVGNFLGLMCVIDGFEMSGAPFASDPVNGYECDGSHEAAYEARRSALLLSCGAPCNTSIDAAVNPGPQPREVAWYLRKAVNCGALWEQDLDGAPPLAWPPPQRPPCPLFADFAMGLSASQQPRSSPWGVGRLEAWYEVDSAGPEQLQAAPQQEVHPNAWSRAEIDGLVQAVVQKRSARKCWHA